MTFCHEAFSRNASLPIMYRGATIGKYLIRKKMSQGEQLFVDENMLHKIKPEAVRFKNKKRIILQGITGVNEKTRLKATLVSNCYCANSVNFIDNDETKINNKYLLALINSSVLNFYFSKFSTNSNVNGYEVDALPIVVDHNFEKNLSVIVDNILHIKCCDENKDTSALEAEIDKLVYQLYGLTEEEIAVVEAANAGKTEDAEPETVKKVPTKKTAAHKKIHRRSNDEYLE